MANEVPIKFAPTAAASRVWADSTFTDTDITRTHQISMASVADNAARQGAKADLGTLGGQRYAVVLRPNLNVAPASGELIEVYFGQSVSATAGSHNPGGLSGADAAYSGTTSDDVPDSVKQLDGPWTLVVTSDIGLQYQVLGIFVPTLRYVSPVIYNKSGQALSATVTNPYLGLYPVLPEIQ